MDMDYTLSLLESTALNPSAVAAAERGRTQGAKRTRGQATGGARDSVSANSANPPP
jgi:hypothetical protein